MDQTDSLNVITVNLKTLAGKTHSITCYKENTLKEFKEKMIEQLGENSDFKLATNNCQLENFTIVALGCWLKDDTKTLNDYNIKDGTNIHQVTTCMWNRNKV